MEFKFQKLTPVDNADIPEYVEALDFVFKEENSDIRNIAISGVFSSGKSSIVNSYEKKKNKNFIHVCIPHFEGAEECQDESVVENKIVNSLLQQIPPEYIPESKYKINSDNTYSNALVTAGVFFIIAFGLYASNFTSIHNFLSKNCGANMAKWAPLAASRFLFVLALLAGISLITFIYYIVKGQHGSKLISKINFNVGEIELDTEEQSYFDKNMDEILYILTHADCDGFVFEDIDRFQLKRVTILEHLRELCILANERLKLQESGKGPIRFFYLVSDDTFSANDKAKFFDFNITVIPVIDGNNSYKMLVDYLKEANVLEGINDRFLRGLSIYIDDLRIAKNIVDDYQIFLSCLSKINIDKTKLLAMVAYKNAFPFDYVNLEKGCGYVYTFFSDKKVFRKEAVDSRYVDIKRINEYKIYQLIKSAEDFDLYFAKEEFNGITENHYYPLLKFLLINGHIDEDSYKTYMSFFYEGGISIVDKEFLMAVNERRGSNYVREISNPKIVVESLDDRDFSKAEVQNYALINYLVSDKAANDLGDKVKEKRIRLFVNQLKEHYDFSFIICYITYSHIVEDLQGCSLFINYLLTFWNESIEGLAEKYNTYLEGLIESNPENDNIKLALNTVIEEGIHFLLPKVFDNRNIKYIELERYLSTEMIYDIKDEDVEDYGAVLSALGVEIADVENKVKNNKFLEEVFTKRLFESDIKMNAKNLIFFLKNREGYDYISMSPIEDITKIDKIYWPLLVTSQKMKASYENVMAYYRECNGIDEAQKAFLNKHGKNVDFTKLLKEEKDYQQEVWEDFALSNFDKSFYEKMCSDVKLPVYTLENIFIEDPLISILIEKKLLVMNKHNIDRVIEDYPDLYVDFIKSNISEFINLFSSNMITDEIALDLLKSSDIDVLDKVNLYRKALGQGKLKELDKEIPKEVITRYRKDRNKANKKKKTQVKTAVTPSKTKQENDVS